MSTSALPVQLGLQYCPTTPFGEGVPFVQGIMSLYKLGVEIRVNLPEGLTSAKVTVGVEGSSLYTLEVQVNEAGYSVTARDSNDNVKECSSFPLQGRGRHWDTSQ